MTFGEHKVLKVQNYFKSDNFFLRFDWDQTRGKSVRRPSHFGTVTLSKKVWFQTKEPLQPCQTPMMKPFCENSWRLLVVYYYRKKSPSYIFDWVMTGSKIRLYQIIANVHKCFELFLSRSEYSLVAFCSQ